MLSLAEVAFTEATERPEKEVRRRRRPALSCIECRRRKIRCDRTEPCKNCIAIKVQCIYRIYAKDSGVGWPPQHRSGSHSAGSSTSHPVTESQQAHGRDTDRSVPEDRDQVLGSHLGPSTLNVSRHGQLNTPRSDGKSSSNSTTTANLDLRYKLQRAQKPEETSTPTTVQSLDETGWQILKRQAGVGERDVVLNKVRIPKWSEWMGTGPEFSSIHGCYAAASDPNATTPFQDAETTSLMHEMRELLEKCKIVAKHIKASRPNMFSPKPLSELTIPLREIADSSVALYFRCFESTHRILYAPTFETEYESYWISPEGASIELRLKVLLVIAIGASFHKQIDEDVSFRNTIYRWINAAQERLSGPLEKSQLTVTGVQIHCLTYIARQLYFTGGNMWTSMGLLIHTAMQINLHRDPKYLPEMSLLQAELRRRLWATIVEMELQISLDSAMPVRISLDDFDTEAPSNINDNEVDEATTKLASHPQDMFTSTSIQLHLLNTMPIRLRILRVLNGLQSKFSYAEVLALNQELADAHRTYNQVVNSYKNSNLTRFHRNLVESYVLRFLLPLRCPFASKARTNPLFHYSRKISLDTAMALSKPEPDETFTQLRTSAGNLLRESLRCTATAISLELMMQADTQRLEGTMYRSSPYAELLKQTLKEIVDLSAEQILRGETNISLHMFLSMVLAQADATATGTPPATKIVQAAKDSLEFCYGLLQTVSGIASLPTSDDTFPAPLDLGGRFEDWDFDWDMELFLPDAVVMY